MQKTVKTTKMRTTMLLFATCCLAALALVACTGGGSSPPKDNYFSGYDGVAMRFLPGTPNTLYYYSTNPSDSDNRFQFNIEVTDKGSADTYGGLYISGYDPGFIDIAGVTVKPNGKIFSCEQSALGADLSDLKHAFFAAITCTIWDSTISGTMGSGTLQDIAGTIGGGTIAKIGEFILEKAGTSDATAKKLAGFLDGFEIHFDCKKDQHCGLAVSYAGDDIDAGYLSMNGRSAIAWASYASYKLIGRNFIDTTHGQEFALLGDRQTYPGGEQDIKTFDGEIKNWPRGLESVPQTFMITSCYVYTTYADPQVCVDPFPESSDRKVCKPQRITYPRGQGGPVAITSIEQSNTPKNIVFTINMQNKGKGIIYHPLSLTKCDPLNAQRVTPKDTNWIYIGDIRLAGNDQEFKCQPTNRLVRLDDSGKGSITCSFPIEFNIRSAYQSPLIISIWYGYSETIQKTIQVKRAG